MLMMNFNYHELVLHTEVGSTVVLLYPVLHRSTFLVPLSVPLVFFKKCIVFGSVHTFSHFFHRYSLLDTSFVICPEWSSNLFKLRKIKQKRSDDNRRPTPLATECGSCGYGTTAV